MLETNQGSYYSVTPNVSYTSPSAYTVGTAISALNPVSTGGQVVSYSVSPALPSGLSLNTATGAITGTPTAITASATYSITAINGLGSTSASISITVNDIAPSALTYIGSPFTYTKGTAITTIAAPTNAGGTPTSYSVSPSLPAGLSLNTATGAITGTPSALATSASYTITATNTGGSASTSILIVIKDISTISATGTTIYIYSGFAQGPASAIVTGSTGIVTYSYSGTGATTYGPSAIAPTNAGTYEVIATVAGDSNYNNASSIALSFTILKGSSTITTIGSTAFTYTSNPQGPTSSIVTGSTGVVTYSYSGTGATIYGPSAIAPTNAGEYEVVATVVADLNYNTASSIALAFKIDKAASTITVTGRSEYNYTGNPQGPNNAIVTGSTGAVTFSYRGTGSTIYGPSLTAPTNVGTYVVEATVDTDTNFNIAISTAFTFTISNTLIAPSALTYTSSQFNYTKGITIVPVGGPTNSGGAITSYSVSPSLPAGLVLNTATGSITGTPTEIISTYFVITATNAVGSTFTVLKITVIDIAPSALNYSGSPFIYTKGKLITPIATPTNLGGVVVRYEIIPALPPGLYFNVNTGEITGIPLVGTTASNYTIKAINSGGSTTTDISITIESQPEDTDSDGINDTDDNCPFISNLNQKDSNGNGIGDVCDTTELNLSQAFTPNGDGVNDYWVIDTIENYPKSIVYVFDRKGNKVFEAKNYQNNWQPQLKSGSYYYQIDLNGDAIIDAQGWIYIAN